jgi:CRISPR-associated protein Cmr1
VRAELRPPSIKGALRFWYRAVDPAYKDREERIFGSTDKGQASFLWRLNETTIGHDPFSRDKYDDAFTVYRHQPDAKNGMIYLGYALKLGGNDRKAIPAGKTFTATMQFKKTPDPSTRKAILAAWWLLGHLGGLGTRSRRGFGTVALRSWEVQSPGDWPELASLPIAHSAQTPGEWLNQFRAGLSMLKNWYPRSRSNDHTILGFNTYFYLFEEGCTSHGNLEAWERALNAAGRAMQDFRQRRPPDYANVMNHLAMRELQYRQRRVPDATLPSNPSVAPNWLASSPERAAFGLPLAFRYGSLYNAGYSHSKTTFQGKDHDRSASPVHVRIIEIGQQCYAFYAVLGAPLLATGEQVKEQSDKGGRNAKAPPERAILDDFRNTVLKPIATEVRW